MYKKINVYFKQKKTTLKQFFLCFFQVSCSITMGSLSESQNMDHRLNMKFVSMKKLLRETTKTTQNSPKEAQQQVAKDLG